jgi:hypothetical protein
MICTALWSLAALNALAVLLASIRANNHRKAERKFWEEDWLSRAHKSPDWPKR